MRNKRKSSLMNNKSKRTIRRMLALALSIVMTLALLPVITPKEAANVQAATLQGPRKDSNGNVIYDCVWFGSYPQAEVVTTAMSNNYTAIGSKYLRDGDLIVDDAVYQTLQKATGWDAAGDITLSSGVRYRRIKKGDATYGTSGDSSYYNWSDDSTYHYFKYQPIKWRVLSVDGGEAMLLADKGLDDREYNEDWTDVTWETCTLRSWLNGYGSEKNSFIYKAFNAQEKTAIRTTKLENKDNPYYGTTGGNSTTDQVFLLSYDDSINSAYGFSSDYSANDKARRIQASTYARAMGTWWSTSTDYSGTSWWWLRSPGFNSNIALDVSYCGDVDRLGHDFCYNNALVPALYLNLSSSNLYNYAGTVCTDGTVKEENSPVSGGGQSVYYAMLTDNLVNSGPSDLFSVDARDKEQWASLQIGTQIKAGDNARIKDFKVVHGSSTESCAEKYDVSYPVISGQTLTLQKDNYRDYIIPSEVITKEKERNVNYILGSVHKVTAYMTKDKKDGKPYISTVYGIINKTGEYYRELQNTELSVTEGEKQTIIISGVGLSGATYYIAQDESHRISSSTGVFSSKDLYSVLDANLDTYAYAVASDGTVTDTLLIKLKKEAKKSEETEALLKKTSIDLLSKDGQKITLADDIPLVGGSEISLDLVEFPVGIYFSGDNIRISIGFDLFSKEHETEYQGGYISKISFEKKWFDFKHNIIDSKDIKDYKDKYNKFKELYEKYGGGQKPVYSNKKTTWNFEIMGYVEGKIVDGNFVTTEGLVSGTGSFKYKYTQQGVFYCIPDYMYVEAGVEIPVTGELKRMLADRNVPFDFGITLGIKPELKVGGGVGFEGVASAGVYADGTLNYENNFVERHHKMSLEGEFGVEAQFCVFKAKKTLLSGELQVFDSYYGSTGKTARTASTASLAEAADSYQLHNNKVTGEVISRDYSEDTSDWLGGGRLAARSLTIDHGVQFSSLQNSVFDRPQAQVVSFGDNKMLMAWIEDDESRDDYNRMRLVYSVYDGTSWSEPKAVCDNGFNDASPALATDGEHVYIAWQNIHKQTTAEDGEDLVSLMNCAEIFTATYDAETDSFAGVKQVTDNKEYDYNPVIASEGGKTVVYWASGSPSAALQTGISRYEYGGGIKKIVGNIGYVNNMRAAFVDGTDEVSYSTDTDGDTSTTNDIQVFTYRSGDVTAFATFDEYQTAYTGLCYGDIDGENTLFTSENMNIYYIKDGQSVPVLTELRQIDGGISAVTTDKGTMLVWKENNDSDAGHEIWSCIYADGKWSEPVMLGSREERISDISLVNNNGQMFGVCALTSMKKNSNNGNYTSEGTNLTSFRFTDFTDLGISLCDMNENTCQVGQSAPVNVFVQNNGTNKVDKASFTITDTLGTKTVVEKDIDLGQGESKMLTLDYPVPDDYSSTTLTVSVTPCDGTDENTDDNTDSISIGNCDIRVMNTGIDHIGDNYIISVNVTNDSAVGADDVKFDMMLQDADSTPYKTESLGSIKRGEYSTIDVVVSEDKLQFDDDGLAKIYFKATGSGNEISLADNVANAVIVKETEHTGSGDPVVDPGTDVKVTGIAFDKNELTLDIGKSYSIIAHVTPDNATNKKLNWTSSNPKYAVVSEQGVVTALAAGVGKTVTITASASDGSGVKATYQIKIVSPALKTQTITAKNITKTYGAKAFSLGAKTNGDGKLTYKSSNTKVAKIDKNGKVTIRGCGKAKITITAPKTKKYNAASKTVTITVKPKKEQITSLKSSKSNTLTVKWKKDTKATGYRIQYSTDKKFKRNVKTVWVKKNTITNKTITRLKAGKKYYVRVAAVHKTGNQKLIGTNSTVKSVRIKE